MKVIKEIKIERNKIELYLEKGYSINDYQVQLVKKHPQSLSIQRDKRSKSHLFFDCRDTCSLVAYLQKTELENLAFLKLMIDILEGIQSISKDFYVVVSIQTIVFKEDGKLYYAVLPLAKDEFVSMKEEVCELLIEIVKEVRLLDGNEIIGFFVHQIKQKDCHITSLLQQLYLRLPEVVKPTIFQRFFLKQPLPEEPTYPFPIIAPVYQEPAVYVEEIDEPCAKTRMLFREHEQGYLEDNQEMIEITKDKFIIGRNSNSDYCLSFPSISKQHAMILKEVDGYYIQDLYSSNATYVNGKKLNPQKAMLLHENDEITFADTAFHFHEDK